MTYIGNDDAVSVKSGWDTAGVEFGRPSVNITVRDSVMTTKDSCVSIGSEMSGGVADVAAYNLTCVRTGKGLHVKTTLGRGGYVRNVSFTDSLLDGVGLALGFLVSYGDHPDAPGSWNKSFVPELADFTFARVRGSVAQAGSLLGSPAIPVRGLTIEDVDLGAPAVGWQCSNVSGTVTGTVSPPMCPELAP